MNIFERENENDFSFWFPKIKDCGIKVPKTFFMRLPSADEDPNITRLYEAFYMDAGAEDQKLINNFVNKVVVPQVRAAGIDGHVFVKNARFSNKFNANGCCNLYGLYKLGEAIATINYEALCVGADGLDEIVIREFIERDIRNTPCIYNGLPLRPEFRVFYDFDTKKPIFTANYWDFDYVFPHLYDATDKIVFEHEREKIESAFLAHKDEVREMVAQAMQNVEGLTGQWSVDILLDERGQFWLIDMALAQRSAYWETRPDKETYPE